MSMPKTKQATDKNAFQWRESPFVSTEGGYSTPSVGQANPGTGDSQRIKKPTFETDDKGD